MRYAMRAGLQALVALSGALGATPAMSAQEASRSGLTLAEMDFVRATSMAANYEIAAARVALATTQSAAVRQFADVMIADHTALLGRIAAVVQAADPAIVLPTGLSTPGGARLKALQQATDGFDLTYRGQMISSHTEEQEAFRTFLEKSSVHSGLRTVVAGAQSHVDAHLAAAKALPRRT